MSTAAATPAPFEPPTGTIKLENPERKNFASFIFGNALHCDRVVTEQSAKGKTVVICGAGPSLRANAAEFCPQGDEVWGCNSAAPWLKENGHKITHGFTVDQTPQMLAEWLSAPDVEYLLASTVHPHLTEYLVEKGRRITWFHNYVGVEGRPVSYAVCTECGWNGDHGTKDCPKCPGRVFSHTANYEEWLYLTLFPNTVIVGSGLNAVTRAIDLALFMGFARIIVLGADCALQFDAPPTGAPIGSSAHLKWLREHTIMHADGGHALASDQSCLTLEGEIDGRLWVTKPDLIVTAVWIEKMRRIFKGRIEVVGDTLPTALRDKPDEFLRRLPALASTSGQVAEFAMPDYLLNAAS